MALLNARGAQVAPLLGVYHQRIYLPVGVLHERDLKIDVAPKELRFGFGKRFELILPSCLDEQLRSAHPDREANRDPNRRRAGERPGIGGEDLRRKRDLPPLLQRRKALIKRIPR
jgi:hypothetical protein